jgi:hypothetical protein
MDVHQIGIGAQQVGHCRAIEPLPAGVNLSTTDVAVCTAAKIKCVIAIRRQLNHLR